MAFGIGINTEHTEQEPLSGTYHEVAVQCWFTATGKSLPLMLKVKGEDEEIIQINHIQVLTVEKQWYAGILNWKYRCQAVLLGKQINFVCRFESGRMQRSFPNLRYQNQHVLTAYKNAYLSIG